MLICFECYVKIPIFPLLLQLIIIASISFPLPLLLKNQKYKHIKEEKEEGRAASKQHETERIHSVCKVKKQFHIPNFFELLSNFL